MQLRYNYRLDPYPRHRLALGKAFGCARVVFNDGLRAREAACQAGEPYLTDAQLSARLTASKATPERTWLTEVSAVVLQQALADLRPGGMAGGSAGSAGSSRLRGPAQPTGCKTIPSRCTPAPGGAGPAGRIWIERSTRR